MYLCEALINISILDHKVHEEGDYLHSIYIH